MSASLEIELEDGVLVVERSGEYLWAEYWADDGVTQFGTWSIDLATIANEARRNGV